MARLSFVVGLLLALGACSSTDTGSSAEVPVDVSGRSTSSTTTVTSVLPDSSSSSTAPQPTTTTVAAPSLEVAMPPELAGFEAAEITVDGRTLVVAVADTSRLRARGLMNVGDLRDLDGMLFVWPQDTTTSFWMKDTLLTLDIAFFDARGAVVGSLVMEPCEVEDCPLYGIDVPYRYALETSAGTLELTSESRLVPPA